MVAPRSESSAKLPPRRNMARERPVLSGQGGSRSGRRFPSGFAAKIMTNEEAIEALARDPNFVTALRDGYCLRTPREDAEVFAASGEFAAIRRLLAARIENATVADVGAGRGLASYAFVRAGARVVYAIEPSASARLGRGAIQSIEAGPRLQVIDGWGEALPLADATADIVFCRQTLHHACDLGRFVAECARVLKPGGVLLGVREHVVDDEAQRAAFLARHPVHRLAGGENAYSVAEYLGALRGAGLRVTHVLQPYDSVICAYPGARDERELVQVWRRWWRQKLGPIVGGVVAWLPGATAVGRRRLNRLPIPGRLYSFLAEKPA